VPALLWTTWTGVTGRLGAHLGAGLFTAIFLTATHSLLILFMILTGRVLKEAMRARPLGRGFLAELNEFFAEKKAYPVALLAVAVTVAAAVLGYGARGFGLPPALHMLAGLVALALNLWAFTHELAAMRDNQLLLDRAAAELDRLDAERLARGEDPGADAPPPELPLGAGRWGLIVGLSAWMPYLYWALIVWKGRFERVPVWPFAVASAAGFAVWLAARRGGPGGA
jgi:hypothetical protein